MKLSCIKWSDERQKKMGILRLYLALCVVAAHSGPLFAWSVHDSHQAVEIFFLISGFYMQMIYGSKYQSAAEFYASRFMRIYIPYWIVLAVTILLALISISMQWKWIWPFLQPYFDSPLTKNGWQGIMFAALSNVSIVFQDWVMFLNHDVNSSLVFASDFRNSNNPLYRYLLIPQAWTIGLEVTFYLLIPWLSKLKSITLLFIVIASIGARIFSYEILDFKRDPWEYRFFPFELALFLLGMLSCRLYRILPIRLTRFQPTTGIQYALGTLALLFLFFLISKATEALSDTTGYHYAVLVAYGFWSCLIPIIFQIFGKWKLDRLIGELSYPVYLSHLLVVSIVAAVLGQFGAPKYIFGVVSAICAIVFAFILYWFIFRPIEEYRYDYAKKYRQNLNS